MTGTGGDGCCEICATAIPDGEGGAIPKMANPTIRAAATGSRSPRGIARNLLTATSPFRRTGVRADVLRCGQRRRRRLRRSWRGQQLTPIGPVPHLLGGRGRDELVVRAYLPTAPQGAVDRGKPGRHATLCHCQVVLRGVQILLRREHSCEISGSEIVLQ